MKISMIILSAGLSERMGVLKPLLPVGEETALGRALSLGKQIKAHTITVVTGFRHEETEAELTAHRAKNIRFVYNTKFRDGMFTSVKAGVHSLPVDIDGFFLLPVDHCAVRPETLEKTIAAFLLAEGQSIVCPTYQGQQGHPPLIPYAFMRGLKDYGGENGMQGYLSAFPTAAVETGDRGAILDMDTPADYAALLKHLGFPTYPDEDACRRLFLKAETPGQIIGHGEQVRALALAIAEPLVKKGVKLNLGLLSAAALLHDIMKTEPEHETAGKKFLLKEGYPDAAVLVGTHMDLPEDRPTVADEASILYLADKLVRGGRVVQLEETFRELTARYADDPAALNGMKKRLTRAMEISDLLKTRYDVTVSGLSLL